MAGSAGVSNTFATGLWFPDAIFEVMRTGAVGANLHERENAINDPFAFDANGLVAHPLLYGMILYARTMGPDAHLVPVSVHTTASPYLKVWAVASGHSTLRVLLINKGASTITTRRAAGEPTGHRGAPARPLTRRRDRRDPRRSAARRPGAGSASAPRAIAPIGRLRGARAALQRRARQRQRGRIELTKSQCSGLGSWSAPLTR